MGVCSAGDSTGLCLVLKRFDTPGENETQLDEGLFEKKISEFFETRKYCSNGRVRKIALEVWNGGRAVDYTSVVNRGFELVDSQDYCSKTHLGYVKN